MAWMLRITDQVPLGNREAYMGRINDVVARLPAAGARFHGSFRVAFGRSLEFMHLIEFPSLDDYEHAPAGTWDAVIEAYRQNLATDSRWEWMRVINPPPRSPDR